MHHAWSDDGLTIHWSFTPDELALVPHRSDANRLGFAVQLKFFDLEGHFPRTSREILLAALGFVAEQLGLSPVRIPVIPATQSGAKLPPHPKEACHPIRRQAAPHRSPIGAQRRLG